MSIVQRLVAIHDIILGNQDQEIAATTTAAPLDTIKDKDNDNNPNRMRLLQRKRQRHCQSIVETLIPSKHMRLTFVDRTTVCTTTSGDNDKNRNDNDNKNNTSLVAPSTKDTPNNTQDVQVTATKQEQRCNGEEAQEVVDIDPTQSNPSKQDNHQQNQEHPHLYTPDKITTDFCEYIHQQSDLVEQDIGQLLQRRSNLFQKQSHLWNTYLYGLSTISQLSDLRHAPEAVMPDNF